MARVNLPNAAVLAARARRPAIAARKDVRIQWFIKNVSDKIAMTMKGRVRMATHFLRVKVVNNIKRPVTKLTGPRGGRVVADRSKPSEFPKAETTQLMKTIFETVRQTRRGVWDGFVGTPLEYGVILETRMDRSFLVRTLKEQRSTIKRLLSGPIKA